MKKYKSTSRASRFTGKKLPKQIAAETVGELMMALEHWPSEMPVDLNGRGVVVTTYNIGSERECVCLEDPDMADEF